MKSPQNLFWFVREAIRIRIVYWTYAFYNNNAASFDVAQGSSQWKNGKKHSMFCKKTFVLLDHDAFNVLDFQRRQCIKKNKKNQ